MSEENPQFEYRGDLLRASEDTLAAMQARIKELERVLDAELEQKYHLVAEANDLEGKVAVREERIRELKGVVADLHAAESLREAHGDCLRYRFARSEAWRRAEALLVLRRGWRFKDAVTLPEAQALAAVYTVRHRRPHVVLRREDGLWLVCCNWLAAHPDHGGEIVTEEAGG